MLITSGNALPMLPASHRHLPLYAVGRATAERAQAQGFERVQSADGDSEALCELVTRSCRPDGAPLLLASGRHQGNPLAAELRRRGFSVVRRVVYAAEPVPSLPDAARDELSTGTLHAALFFSAETARTCGPSASGQSLAGSSPRSGCRGYRSACRRGIRGTSLAARPRRCSARSGRDAGTAAMSDPIALPPPEPEPPHEPPPASPPPQRHLLPWLTGAGFLILAIAIVWVWQNPAIPPPPPAQDAALAQQVAALQARVAQLEQRPQQQSPNLAALEARVAALEQRPPASTPDLVPAHRPCRRAGAPPIS